MPNRFDVCISRLAVPAAKRPPGGRDDESGSGGRKVGRQPVQPGRKDAATDSAIHGGAQQTRS
ncbi:hypothetical protein J2X35_000142 [Mesorhizobium sp. BE184]|nr:hypothetical protein [Mesorhizobium sp. BE184]